MGVGRPKIELNAEYVTKLAKRGNKTREIADFFGVSHDTITRNFASELIKGRAERNVSLRETQIQVAEAGNPTMLIWLGKQYLKQTDSAIDEYIMDAIKSENITKEDLLNLIKNRDKIDANKEKVPFEEFCTTAGYPKPYPKQLEMMNFGLTNKDPRLLLGARGYGKTDYITILGVAYKVYLLGINYSCLIITKEKKRASAIIGEIASALRLNGVSLEKENSSCVRVTGRVGKDHSVEGLSIGAGFRGRHPNEAIMDDPVTEEDTSEAVREKAEKKYSELLKLTKNVLIIGQPAHKEDLYAHLRPLLLKMEVPHGTIPELDHDLEAMKLAGIDSRSLEMSYHLKVPMDGTNPFDKIKYMDGFPTGNSTVAFIDPSFTGGDYTALTIIKGHMDGVAVVGFAYKKSWNHCLDEMLPSLMKYNVKRIAIETNSLGDLPVEMLNQVFPGIGIVGRVSNTNKHSRIMAAGAYAHLIHLSKDSHKTYIDQVVKYEFKAKFDDCPDSMANAMIWLGLVRGKQ